MVHNIAHLSALAIIPEILFIIVDLSDVEMVHLNLSCGSLIKLIGNLLTCLLVSIHPGHCSHSLFDLETFIFITCSSLKFMH